PDRCGDASQSTSTSCENQWTRLFYFAPAFGVRTRPRVAFLPGTTFSETVPCTTKHFSRRQPLDQPTAIRLSCVTKPVMQTVGTALPEFDPIRFEPITAPVRRQWNRLVAEAFSHLCHGLASRPAVAKLIAFTSRMPTSIAAVNQFPNCLIGSGSRSPRRRPLPACSYREAAGSRGTSIIVRKVGTTLSCKENVDAPPLVEPAGKL